MAAETRLERRPLAAVRGVDDVVVLLAGRVLQCRAFRGLVVERLVGADVRDKLQVARAAGGRDVVVPELSELDGVRADATGRSGDQDVAADARAVELGANGLDGLKRPSTGSPAASAEDTPAGRATVMLSDAATYSARPPAFQNINLETILSPTLNS